MSSVWKRIQRVGKRASKFQFIASYQTLTLECSRDGKWQPNKLGVVWTRRNRRKAVKPETWQPSIANPFRGMIVWTDPEEIEISVTLYKDAREGSPFEDKLWTFVIEDESITGKRRPVASVSVNMVDYHSVDLKTFCLNLPLRPASKKVVSASLELNLACVLLKEGNATDEDMISMSSLLSLNDPYGSREFDSDHFPGGKNFKRNAGKRLSLRSAKSKSKPTFNLASNTESPKESKKNVKNKGKSQKNDIMNKTVPANHVTVNGLNKPMSTSDTDLTKIDNRTDFKKPKKEEQMSTAEKSLLKWCQECVEGYANVNVTNMTTSWRNGLAFCAIIHHFNPGMIDFSSLKPDDIRENNRLAFEAFEYLGISRMLDPHQMVLSSVPDKLLIMTYLHQIKQHFTTKKKAAEDDGRDDDVTLATIVEAERSLILSTETLINDLEDNDFTKLKKRESSDVKTDTSKGDHEKVEYEANPGYNPFDEDVPITQDDIDIGITPDNTEECKSRNSETVDSKVNKKSTSMKEERNSPPITSSEKLEINSDQNAREEGKKFKHENALVNSVKETHQNIGEETQKPRGREGQNALEKIQKQPKKETEISTEDPWTHSTNAWEKERHLKINKKDSEIAPEKPEKIDKDKNSLQNANKTTDNEGTLNNVPKKHETLDIKDKNSLQQSAVLYSPKPGYNPFFDDDTTGLSSKTDKVEKPKSLNPFDEDFVDDINENETVLPGKKSKSLNPFDEDYEEPFETDVDKILSYVNDDEVGSNDINKAAGSSGDSLDESLGACNNSDRSPRVHSPRLQTRTDTSSNETVPKDTSKNELLRNSTSAARSNRSLPKTSDSINASSVVRTAENGQVSQMHRKETRRPAERPSTLASEPAVRKQLTESHVKLKRPESENLGRKATPASPTPARGQLSVPTSPRSRIPSFEEWKAKKSDEAAKQEKLKAQARQMIKEARAKSVKTQNVTNSSQGISAEKPTTTNLPPLTTSKKYKAPEPPNAPRQGSLASKLKNEIEYQKKITEKTRKTLESSRIKRINPKQENMPEVEQRSTRSEKVQQAIREARENTKATETATDSPPSDISQETMATPPKPPRVYTYSEETGAKERVEPQETGTRNETEETNETESTQENAEDENDPSKASLQQNPFKLTFKKKDTVPQAVVKPLPSTTGRDTKIDLKKYSIKTRKLSETCDEISAGSVDRISDQLTSSRESSDHDQTSEEDVNDILDNVGDLSESENKTDEELYDNGEDEEGFQDTSQYVEHEIAVLEEDRIALDRVAVKLEKELREAMNTADCKEEEQRLFQEWFLLVNKRNEIVRRQTELSILEKEEDLEKRFELLNRELRFLMADSNREKTAQEKKREELLLAELVRLVNKRDELVRIEDSQVQEAEKAAQHVEHVVRNTKIPKKQGECCIQ